jgi:cytidylate kinase
MQSIEKERMTGIEDFISSLINKDYIWSGLYLEHLIKIIKVIAAHGRAVIVGRGADFILRPEKRFSVRIIAPIDIRIQNVVSTYGVSESEAEKRILKRESRRRRFIKEAFDGDVDNPIHYDMILNTGRLSIDAAAVSIIIAAKTITDRT